MEHIRLKPQAPTFEDSSRHRPVAPPNSTTGDHSSGSSGREASPVVSKAKKPSVDTIDPDDLITNKLNSITSLDHLTSLDALCIFKRLVDDLMKLNQIYRPNNYNGEKLKDLEDGQAIIDGIDHSFDLKQFFLSQDGDDSLVLQDLKLLSGQCDDSGNLDMNKVPKLMHGSINHLVDVRPGAVRRDVAFAQDKPHSTSHSNYSLELEVPIKKKSKISFNFEISPPSKSNLELHKHECKEPEKKLITKYDTSNKETPIHLQYISKFYLKAPPKLSLTTYLDRINQYINPSTAVMITASYYLFNLVFSIKAERESSTTIPLQAPDDDLKMLPVDQLNVFRLVLTVIRVSLKLIEDKNYKQAYYCKVCGLQSLVELFRLELNCLYLLDFNSFINENLLVKFLFQFKLFDLKLHRYLKNKEEH